MRLLVITQALDLDDPLLSAYHGWVEALAREVSEVQVICLKEGRHALPENVTVHSLGKEHGARSKVAYARSFVQKAWKLRNTYDVVFVHMNQEYLLIAGWVWKLLGKNIYMWRNHYAGSLLTDLAAAFCTNVFCTSRRSYTATYKKTVFMPVGVNTERFSAEGSNERVPRSVLFFSRIAPSKHPELLIEALHILAARGVSYTALLVGSAPPEYAHYAKSLEEQVRAYELSNTVRFLPGAPNSEAPEIYRSHELFVNCSPSGMLDKTIFEAAASGCLVLTESEDMRAMGFEDVTYTPGNAEDLADNIVRLLNLSGEARKALQERLGRLSEEHSLTGLAKALVAHMSGGR